MSNRFGLLVSLIRTVIRTGGCVLIAWIAFHAVNSLSGAQTDADFSFSITAILNKIPNRSTFAWIATGISVPYAIGQHVLRTTKVQRLAKRIKFLEQQLNGRRQSSDSGDDA